MSKRIGVLLTALLLTLVLAACGGSGRDHPQDSTQNGTAPENGLLDDDRTDDGAVVTPDQPPAVTEDPDRQLGVPLDEMLENARVRDRNGDLLDGDDRASAPPPSLTHRRNRQKSHGPCGPWLKNALMRINTSRPRKIWKNLI